MSRSNRRQVKNPEPPLVTSNMENNKPTKYMMNKHEDVVVEMLQGLTQAHSHLTLYAEQKVVLGQPLEQTRVNLLSGGGSGHEPFAAGYVGEGMLSGAVAGNIFTSPPAASVEAALQALCADNQNGVLMIIANYTGDVLNFGIACEKVKAQGHAIEMVTVGEDCALLNTGRISLAGRRGMCGIVFVIKIAGAMAVNGKTLQEIASESKTVANSVSTLGVCLEACSIPGSKPMFTLAHDQMDLGLGIHGEAGICRRKMTTADQIVGVLLDKIGMSLKLQSGCTVCVLVNNLGTLTQLEMGIVLGEIHEYFKRKNMSIARIYSGHFMTSLDMKGFQVCVLRLDSPAWVTWLDADTTAPAWPRVSNPRPAQPQTLLIGKPRSFEEIYEEQKDKWNAVQLGEKEIKIVQKCLDCIRSTICSAQRELNNLDKTCGDGDCGDTLDRLMTGVRELIGNKTYISSPLTMLHHLQHWAQSHMGGTSGALYSLFFLSAASYVQDQGKVDWVRMFIAGVNGILNYSTARQGDRTMLDVLIECKNTLEQLDTEVILSRQTLDQIEDNVTRACESTKYMIPRAGRASNVDSDLVNDKDAGAYGVQLWINRIIRVLKEEVYT